MNHVLVVYERPAGSTRNYPQYAIGPFDGSGPANDYRQAHGIDNCEVVELWTPTVGWNVVGQVPVVASVVGRRAAANPNANKDVLTFDETVTTR